MKVFSISVVKNEADIIESFVRYHSQLFDGMVLLDNGSSDRTVEILESLSKEGLPISILSDPYSAHIQDKRMTALMYRTFAYHAPDLVIPLDADEFLVAASPGDSPRDLLCQLDPTVVPLLRWRGYVPHPSDDQSDLVIPRQINHVRPEKYDEFYKVAVSLAVVKKYAPNLTMGSHDLVAKVGNAGLKRVEATGLRLAHFPVRSLAQLRCKTLVGWVNNLSRSDRDFGESLHWQSMFDQFTQDKQVTMDDLAAVAIEYGTTRKPRDVETELLPLDPSLTGAIRLRYTTNSEVNPIRSLLCNCETLAKEYSNLKKHLLGLGIHTESTRELLLQLESPIRDENDWDRLAEDIASGRTDCDSVIYRATRGIPPSPDMLNGIAVNLYQRARFEEALNLLNAALPIDPTNTNTLFNLGCVLPKIGNSALALRCLELIQDKDAEVLEMIASIRVALNASAPGGPR